MTETETNARFAMLQRQRDEAMNQVVILNGTAAVLAEEIKTLKEEVVMLKET